MSSYNLSCKFDNPLGRANKIISENFIHDNINSHIGYGFKLIIGTIPHLREWFLEIGHQLYLVHADKSFRVKQLVHFRNRLRID